MYLNPELETQMRPKRILCPGPPKKAVDLGLRAHTQRRVPRVHEIVDHPEMGIILFSI